MLEDGVLYPPDGRRVVVLILGGIGVLRLVDGEGDLALGTEYVGCCCGLEVTGFPWVAIK